MPIEIFRAGRHTAMSGESLAFSDADLKASAAAYDPAVHEAPICVGHPEHDAPAYGWVGKLAFGAGALSAEPRQVDPQFAELVKAGRYKKISAAFYRPDSPANPKPGVYYLRHVGFLGAQPPAVKGLKPAQFAGTAEEVVVFAELKRGTMLGRLRDFLIEKFGESAAEAIPADDAEDLTAGAPQNPDNPKTPDDDEDQDMPNVNFAEQQKALDERTKALEAREAEIAARDKAIKDKEAAFSEQDRAKRRDANGVLLAGLEREGRVLPAHRPLLLAFLERLEGGEKLTVAFGEKGEDKELSQADAFKEFLKRLPPQVSFAEVAKTEAARTVKSVAPMAIPPGMHVDQDQLELRDRALAYAEEHKIDFLEAVRRLEQAA